MSDTPGKALDEALKANADTDAKQDAALRERADIDRIIGEEIIALKALAGEHSNKISDLLSRVLALEEASPPGPVNPPDAPAVFPNTDDGLPIMQIGVSWLAYFSLEDPYLNLLRVNGLSWKALDAAGKLVMDYAQMWDGGFIDKETLVPNKLPPGAAMFRSGIFRDGARYYPEYYGGTYVVEWDGEASTRVAHRRIGKNRVEIDYPDNYRDHDTVEFTSIGSGFKNPRVYRKEHEALIKEGKELNPQWVEHVRAYKVLRSMDLQNTNTAYTRSVDQLPKKSALHYGESPQGVAAYPKGIPVEALFDMANETDTALWMNVPPYIGAPQAVEGALASNDWGALRTIAKASARAIIASPEWRKYADEIVRSLKSSGYPRNRMLYVENFNEDWNFANPFGRATYYSWGLGEGLKDQAGYSWALGYATANFSAHFEAALKAAGIADQAWTPVLAGQMANTETTKGALAGFKAYFSERNIDPAPYLKRLGVSTASYYHGAFSWGNLSDGIFPGLTVDQWKAKWLAEIAADPEGLKKRVADFVISGPDTVVGTIPNLVKNRKAHQKLAEDAGAFFLGDYEGESHDTSTAVQSWGPVVINWVEDWRAGPHGERMTKAWVEAMRAQNPNAIIANFNSIGPRDPEGNVATDNQLSPPWIDAFWGEETGRTRALKPYLRQAQ